MTNQPTKREALPWFAFNVAEYLKDTMKLGTESHGAYLLLMLDYYANAEPCPDDDFVLAAVCKLTEEVWKKHRRVLEPHFDVRDGFWFHKRIERELDESSRRLQAAKALAVAGGKARGAQAREERRKAAETAAKAPKVAGGVAVEQPATQPQPQPQSSRDPSRGAAHYTLNKEDSLSTAAPPETGLQEEGDEEDGIGAPIPPNWRPSDQVIVQCLEEATQEEFEREVTTFVNRNLSEGGFSINWNAAFSTWWIRFKDHRAKAAKKAPARIEVNKSPEEAAASMEATIDRGVAMFAKGIQWSRGLGPEPGQIGCRIPHDVLRKHGIDPATGLKLRKETA